MTVPFFMVGCLWRDGVWVPLPGAQEGVAQRHNVMIAPTA